MPDEVREYILDNLFIFSLVFSLAMMALVQLLFKLLDMLELAWKQWRSKRTGNVWIFAPKGTPWTSNPMSAEGLKRLKHAIERGEYR